jgi:hypothetical protein
LESENVGLKKLLAEVGIKSLRNWRIYKAGNLTHAANNLRSDFKGANTWFNSSTVLSSPSKDARHLAATVAIDEQQLTAG